MSVGKHNTLSRSAAESAEKRDEEADRASRGALRTQSERDGRGSAAHVRLHFSSGSCSNARPMSFPGRTDYTNIHTHTHTHTHCDVTHLFRKQVPCCDEVLMTSIHLEVIKAVKNKLNLTDVSVDVRLIPAIVRRHELQ